VLAYEAVFGVPARELCAGIYDRIREVTAKRAETLAAKLAARSQNPATARKLELFRRVAAKGEGVPLAA